MTIDPQLPRPDPTPSFWQEPPHPTVSNVQSINLPRTTDFAVIGSGITGCSVTKALLEQASLNGKKITVLEARTLCSSATGRNGGHLVSDTPDSFAHLVPMFGRDEAKRVARFSFASMDRMKEVVAGLADDLKEKAQLREVTSVTGFGDTETFERFKSSLAMFEETLPELRGRNEVIGRDEAQKVSSVAIPYFRKKTANSATESALSSVMSLVQDSSIKLEPCGHTDSSQGFSKILSEIIPAACRLRRRRQSPLYHIQTIRQKQSILIL